MRMVPQAGGLRREKGFTIVEVLVSLAILIFGVYELYAQFVETGGLSRRHARKFQAQLAAESKLNELLVCRYDDLKAWTPPAEPAKSPEHPNVLTKTEIAAQPDGGLRIKVTAEPVMPAKNARTAEPAVVEGVRYR